MSAQCVSRTNWTWIPLILTKVCRAPLYQGGSDHTGSRPRYIANKWKVYMDVCVIEILFDSYLYLIAEVSTNPQDEQQCWTHYYEICLKTVPKLLPSRPGRIYSVLMLKKLNVFGFQISCSAMTWDSKATNWHVGLTNHDNQGSYIQSEGLWNPNFQSFCITFMYPNFLLSFSHYCYFEQSRYFILAVLWIIFLLNRQ